MTGRDEICGAMEYMIKALGMGIDPSLEVEINGDTIPVGNIIKHAEELYVKISQEKNDMGGGDMVQLTRNAYIELMKKIEVADRALSAPIMEEASAGTGRPS